MALGIFPLGSGNGLARSNRIPLDLKQALQIIERGP
jgi:diacylglycerol kinase family enzyme